MVRAALLLVLLSSSIPSLARAATIVVDTTDAELPAASNGNCTLREALRAANDDVAVDGCAAGSGEDTIVLATGATYRFEAAETGLDALPVVRSSIVLSGTNTTLVRIGTTLFRFLEVDAAGSLRIEGISFSSGDVGEQEGGALLSAGALHLERVQIGESHALAGGGLAAHGDTTIVESRFVANSATERGGAIVGDGSLSILSTSFEDNALDALASCTGCAREGGAIAAGSLSVEACTFVRNQATAILGSSPARGGAIAAVDVSALNTVFLDNLAAGVDAEGSGIASTTLALTHCTFAGNPRITTAEGGASLDVSGSARLVGTVLTHAGARPLVPLCGAALSGPIDHSYFDDASCDGVDDGGAPTNALGIPPAGSALLDAAALSTCPPRDRNGASRPAGAGCDIGAYEIGGAVPAIVVGADAELITSEDGMSTRFVVRLATAPTAPVSLAVHSSDAGEVTFEPAMLTFDATNWSTLTTVTLRGVDDPYDDGDAMAQVALLPATSADPAYSGLFSRNLTVLNLDDDTAGIMAAVAGDTGEDGTATILTVQLASAPLDPVTLVATSLDLAEGTVSGTLMFTDADWEVPQSFTVTGVDDALLDGDVMFEVSVDPAGSADVIYAALPSVSVQVRNVDDERPDAGGRDAGALEDASVADAGVSSDAGVSAPSAGCSCRATAAEDPALAFWALGLLALLSRRRFRS